MISDVKYLVTAPPGGLGHFLSRVLNQSYDYQVGSKGQYHSLEKTYSSQTTQFENYQGLRITPDKVICLHNFDNQDFSLLVSDRVIVNVIIDGHWPIYLNNWYRKAIQSNLEVEQSFLQKTNDKFPSSGNALREEFYWLYLHAIDDKIPWLHQHMHGMPFLFSHFYDKDSFIDAVAVIPGSDLHGIESIWYHFWQSQQIIIEKTNLYEQICSDLIGNKRPKIPESFDNVDFGIMSGMIQHRYGQDLLNLQNDAWI